MTFFGANLLTAIATAVLAVFATATAWYARRAYRAQSSQLDDQRKLNERQTPVLELQAEELRESLDERKREADDKSASQATKVTAWFEGVPGPHRVMGSEWGAMIRNASDLPVFDVRAFFYQVLEATPGGPWGPIDRSPAERAIRVLPPESDRHVGANANIQDAGSRGVAEYVVSIEFTDAAGNHWERDPRGALNPRS